MQITINLDSDVLLLLRNESRLVGSDFDFVVNEVIRKALERPSKVTHPIKPFVVKARNMGLQPGIDPTRLAELADEMEDDAFVEAMQRLERELKGQ